MSIETKLTAVIKCEGVRAPTERNYKADWQTKIGWETLRRDDSANGMDCT